jgi:hypothetical protein
LVSATTPAERVAFELTPTKGAPSRAREALRPIARAVAGRTYFDLTSVVSELVAACVRGEGRGLVRVEVSVRHGWARGAVYDDPSGLLQPPSQDTEAGRIGRRILDELCEEWRVQERPGGTRVEFRVPASAW